MTTTIFDDITELVFPALSYFCVGGTSWHVYRGDSNGVVTLQTDPITCYIVPNNPDKPFLSIPQIQIFNKPWTLFAAIGTLVQSNDILVSVADSSFVIAVVGRVTHFMGMLGAPGDETELVI